jgi:hypothetical protein
VLEGGEHHGMAKPWWLWQPCALRLWVTLVDGLDGLMGVMRDGVHTAVRIAHSSLPTQVFQRHVGGSFVVIVQASLGAGSCVIIKLGLCVSVFAVLASESFWFSKHSVQVCWWGRDMSGCCLTASLLLVFVPGSGAMWPLVSLVYG